MFVGFSSWSSVVLGFIDHVGSFLGGQRPSVDLRIHPVLQIRRIRVLLGVGALGHENQTKGHYQLDFDSMHSGLNLLLG
jgi:hypothetical protein